MNHPVQLAYETRVSNVQHKHVGASDFRIHTWFDHTRNMFVVEVMTANDPVPERKAAKGAAGQR